MSAPGDAPPRGNLHFLVYTPQKGSTIADALGTADYSYYFVMQHFMPVLRRIGEVSVVTDPLAPVDAIRARGQSPVLLVFMPPHKVPGGSPCPMLPVFAWEYTSIPTDPWSREPRNDWRTVLGEAGGAITHSAFAVRAIQAALGRRFPACSLPAPIWDRYARLGSQKRGGARREPRTLAFQGVVLDSQALLATPDMNADTVSLARTAQSVVLSGVVYTAALNPADGRKNWGDLLAAFVWTLRDEPDALLLLKLIHHDVDVACRPILARLLQIGPHRCRVVAIQGFLDDEAYDAMIVGSSFVVNCATGEGQCLPLMEFMSAGTPALAPDHTAMGEYVSTASGFPIRSCEEWTQWPHDSRGVLRCFQRRVEWESIQQAFAESWRVATSDPARYAALSQGASEALRRYCSQQTVSDRLRSFLGEWLALRERQRARAMRRARVERWSSRVSAAARRGVAQLRHLAGRILRKILGPARSAP